MGTCGKCLNNFVSDLSGLSIDKYVNLWNSYMSKNVGNRRYRLLVVIKYTEK